MSFTNFSQHKLDLEQEIQTLQAEILELEQKTKELEIAHALNLQKVPSQAHANVHRGTKPSISLDLPFSFELAESVKIDNTLIKLVLEKVLNLKK